MVMEIIGKSTVRNPCDSLHLEKKNNNLWGDAGNPPKA